MAGESDRRCWGSVVGRGCQWGPAWVLLALVSPKHRDTARGPGSRTLWPWVSGALRMRSLGDCLWVCGKRGRWATAGKAPGVTVKEGAAPWVGNGRQGAHGMESGRDQQKRGAASREGDGEGGAARGVAGKGSAPRGGGKEEEARRMGSGTAGAVV